MDKEFLSKCKYLYLLLECAKEYGAEVRPAKPGEGGIYVNGKKMAAEELFSDWEKDETELLS